MSLGRRSFLRWAAGLGAAALAAPLLPPAPAPVPPPPPLWIPPEPEKKIYQLDRSMLVPKPKVVVPEYSKFSSIGETGVYVGGERIATVRQWQAHQHADVVDWAFGAEAPRRRQGSMDMNVSGGWVEGGGILRDPEDRRVMIHTGEFSFEGYIQSDTLSMDGYSAEIKVTHAVRNVGGKAHVVYSDGLHRNALESKVHVPPGEDRGRDLHPGFSIADRRLQR